MAHLWYGHFDSTPTDERYLTAEDWAGYIRSFVTDGVRNGGACLQVTPAGGLAVNVDNGVANIQGYVMALTGDVNGRYLTLPLPAAHPQYPRIDRIVLRLDRGEARTLVPAVLMGTAAASPVPPALSRSASGYWELSLAQVRVGAAALNISAGDITDERMNTNACGLMNSVLGLDPSVWQAQFDAFMANTGASLGAKLSALDTQISNAFNAYSNELSADLTSFLNTWQGWFAGVQQDTQGVYFNFDNWAAISGVTRTADYSDPDNITETIVNAGSGAKIAVRATSSVPGGKAITETLYKSDGVTVFRSRRSAVNFAPGKVTEAIA